MVMVMVMVRMVVEMWQSRMWKGARSMRTTTTMLAYEE